MHGHALLSKACLGFIHKHWLAYHPAACRGEERPDIILLSSLTGAQERSLQGISFTEM